MIKNFTYLDHKIEMYYNEKESNYFIYKEGQFLLKGKGYKGFNFRANGALKDAKEAVVSLTAKDMLKKRLGRFYSAFNFLK